MYLKLIRPAAPSNSTSVSRHEASSCVTHRSILIKFNQQIQSTNSSGVTESITAISSSPEYQSTSHYINESGQQVDLGIDSDATSSTFQGLLAPGAQLTERTFEEVYLNVNESLRSIKIIKPSLIGTLISSYKKAMRE